MSYFNGTELRSMMLATGLLLVGVAARLGFGPGPDDFSWTDGDSVSVQPVSGLGDTRRRVSRGVAEETLAETPLGPGERLDPNTAPPAQLRRLPGIGPTLAAAIVRERASGGAFRSAADLARVPGIGKLRIEALEPHLTFALGALLGHDGSAHAPIQPRTSPVNVNRAQIKELEQITGIGPVLAARIVATRHRFGRFERLEDLLRVPGIGPSVLGRIAEQVRY